MTDRLRLAQALRRILWQLNPYLGELVVIGGWVPHLYREAGGFETWHGEPALTAEVDVLVPPELSRAGREPITGILRSAGFEPVAQQRPVAVWASEPATGEKSEFLRHHTGPARRLSEIVSVPDQEEMGAISLDGLQILGTFTRTLVVDVGEDGGKLAQAHVRVPLLGPSSQTRP